MRRIIAPFLIILLAATSLVSCLNDDDNNTVYYSDAALSSFNVTSIVVNKTTKSSQGTDSTYTENMSTSSYVFQIDQDKREIYNLDSLPYGTDGTKLLVNVTTVNNGVAGLKAVLGTDVTAISSTDSLDFSVPRTIVVRSSDGKYSREYTVKVNIHKQKAEDFNWTKLAESADIASFEAFRAFAIDGKIVAFGSDGTNTKALQTSASDGASWIAVTFNFNGMLPADMYQKIVKKGNRLYMIKDGKLLSSADGATWDEEGSTEMKQLIAASSDKLYAYDESGEIMSSSDGTEWNADGMDTSSSMLPTTDICYAFHTLRTNNDVERVVLAGNRDVSAFEADTAAVIWNKLDDTGSYAVNLPWAYYTFDIKSKYVLPRLAGLSMTSYGEYLLALGGKGIGACKETGFSQIYSSLDGGLTWQNEAMFQLPEGIDKTAKSMALVTDDEYHLWIICAGTGQIWRGRLNSMGWLVGK